MRVVVVGGSIAGLSAALFLARSGHEVTVLEADDEPTPEDMSSEDLWFRRGTPHSSQAHNFGAGFVREFRLRAPDFVQALFDGGVIHRKVDELRPAAFAGQPTHPDDDQFEVISSRRPFLEWRLRRTVIEERNVTWRPGTSVRGLESVTFNGTPHVTGVRTDGGERIRSDAVVDACGRRSPLKSWLREIGAKPPVVREEPCDQVYFGRYYLLDEGAEPPPPNNGFVVVAPLPFGAVLIFPGDNGVLQCATGFLPDDHEMKQIRDPARFHRLFSALPATKPWIDLARPLGHGVQAMGSLRNTLRRIVSDGTPHVTGLHAIGDARCTTNPQYGRGVGHAAIDAGALCDSLSTAADEPATQALLMDEEADRMLAPSFIDSARLDRARGVMWRAALQDEKPRFPSPEREREAELGRRALVGLATDPEIWRACTRGTMLLDPPGRWREDPAMLERLAAIDLDGVPPPEMPTRADVLNIIS